MAHFRPPSPPHLLAALQRSNHPIPSDSHIIKALAVLPQNAAALLSTFYVELNETKTVPIKLQKVLMKAAHARANEINLSNHFRPSSTLDITKSDIIEAHAPSQASRIFTAPLSVSWNRMDPNRFTAWVRAFLRVPQQPHLGNLANRAGLPYQTERCLAEHTKNNLKAACLDLHGNHANSNCPSVAAGRHRRHKLLRDAFKFLAVKAGCTVMSEPATNELLLNAFTAEQCRKLFPKAPTVAFSSMSAKIVDDVALWEKMSDGPKRDKLGEDIQTRIDGIEVKDGDKTGLRADLFIQDTETFEQLWVDNTTIHTTCRTRLSKQFTHILNELKSVPTSTEDLDDDSDGKGGAAADQRAFKHKKYAPLLAIAAKQFMDGMRQSNPKFLAPVATTHGEMGEDSFALQEWLTKAYKRSLLRAPDRLDGLTHAQLTAAYRNNLRLAIQIATAKGQADMINSAGLPRSSCKKHAYK